MDGDCLELFIKQANNIYEKVVMPELFSRIVRSFLSDLDDDVNICIENANWPDYLQNWKSY